MENQYPEPLAPFNFARCFNTQCSKANSCLHHLAAVHDTPEYTSLRVVNPIRIPKDKTLCPYFQSTQKIHVAWGIEHLFDEVRYKYVKTLKNQLIGYFGRGKYYRFYRKECYLTPEDQEYIRKMFQKTGITEEPVFESYSDEYRW